jgi:hypothetical protein
MTRVELIYGTFQMFARMSSKACALKRMAEQRAAGALAEPNRVGQDWRQVRTQLSRIGCPWCGAKQFPSQASPFANVSLALRIPEPYHMAGVGELNR